MTKGTFGDHLKREREMRGVSLDEISAATRIATRFLTAIEEEQWDHLPGGVFNRGFVRAVARYLGLDEENIVAEYAAAAGDRPTVPVWTGSPPAVTPERPWLAWILAGVVVLVLASGGFFAVRRMFTWRATRRAAQIAAESATSSPAQPALPSGTESVPVSTEPAPTTTPDSTGMPRGANAPPAPGTDPKSPDPGARFQLKVEAGETTSVTVDADTRRVFEGTMKAGEDRFFTARDKKALAPMGPSGHEGKTTLTRESLKGPAGGGN
jgi:cytoskeletal protein RodZ